LPQAGIVSGDQGLPTLQNPAELSFHIVSGDQGQPTLQYPAELMT